MEMEMEMEMEMGWGWNGMGNEGGVRPCGTRHDAGDAIQSSLHPFRTRELKHPIPSVWCQIELKVCLACLAGWPA